MLTFSKLQKMDKETFVRTTIEASDSNVEIFLIDGRYRMVDKGIGTLDVTVPPGLYTIKYKAGNVTHEDEKLLVPGQDMQWIHGPKLSLESALPTLKTSKKHAMYAQYASMEVHQKPGSGAQLFLFVRDLDNLARTRPSTALILLDNKGRLVIDFDKAAIQGESVSESAPYSTINIELDPGIYFLQNHTDEVGILMQSIVLSPGWQTQLFMTRRSVGSGKKGRRADMADASILMAPIGHGFEPSSDNVRLTEIAKSALEQKRPAVGRELHDMLWKKYENPILGLIGAHLMLRQKNYDRNLLETVVSNLVRMLGDEHPDIKSLFLQIREDAFEVPLQKVKYPPMLQASWEKILQASIENPEIMDADSLAAQVSMTTLNTASWLVWKKPRKSLFRTDDHVYIHSYDKIHHQRKRVHSKIIKMPSPKVESAITMIPGITNYQGTGDDTDFRKELLALLQTFNSEERNILDKRHKFNIQEKALLSYFAVLASSNPLSENKRKIDATGYYSKKLSNEAIVEALGIPASLVEQLLRGIAAKLIGAEKLSN